MLARSPSPDHMSTPSRSTRIEHVRPSPQLSLPQHWLVRRVTVTAPSYVPCVVSVVNSESGMASGQLEHNGAGGERAQQGGLGLPGPRSLFRRGVFSMCQVHHENSTAVGGLLLLCEMRV